MKLRHSDSKNLMFIYNLLQGCELTDLNFLEHLCLEEYIELIEINWNHNSFSTADIVINTALAKFPENVDLIDKKIQNHIYEQDYESAYLFLQHYASDILKPFDTSVLEVEILYHMNKLEEADRLLDTIEFASEEQESTILYYKGLLAQKASNPFRAEEYFKQSILTWSENQLPQAQLSRIIIKENKLAENENFIDQVLNINPFAYQFWFCKGKIYKQRGEYQEALEAFDFAYVSCEKYFPAIEEKLELFLENNNFDFALQELILIIEHFEPSVYHYIQTAQCFKFLDKIEKARQILHFAIEMYPDEEDIFHELSLIELVDGDYTLSLEFILQAISINHHNEDFHTLAAEIYVYLNKDHLAKAHLKESLYIDHTNSKNWLKLCSFDFYEGDYNACLTSITESKEHTFCNHIEVLKAATYFEMGERSHAFNILNDVIEEDIDSINAIFEYIPSLENDVELNALMQVYQPL